MLTIFNILPEKKPFLAGGPPPLIGDMSSKKSNSFDALPELNLEEEHLRPLFFSSNYYFISKGTWCFLKLYLPITADIWSCFGAAGFGSAGSVSASPFSPILKKLN